MFYTRHKEIAILVFANSSKEELNNKSMPSGARVFDVLTELTLKTVKKTKLPYFHLSEKEQYGNSFGERFSNAIHSVFEKGYERIITIGNDTPYLKASHIMEASRQLANGKNVLGPSTDGGFYLMGLHKSHFSIGEFQKLSWQTSTLLNEVAVLLGAKHQEPLQLPVLFDLDNVKDFQLFFKRFKSIPIKLLEIFKCLFTRTVENFCFIILFFDNYYFKVFYNKGSPSLLHT